LSKYDTWYDNLPENTKAYLRNQPIWHDSDMWKAGIIGVFVGILIGIIFRG
jgi:hypothetical protein